MRTASACFGHTVFVARGSSCCRPPQGLCSCTSGLSCPSDRKVCVNTRTRIYHLEGERWWGRTKQGQFECEKTAKAEGDRETENGQ